MNQKGETLLSLQISLFLGLLLLAGINSILANGIHFGLNLLDQEGADEAAITAYVLLKSTLARQGISSCLNLSEEQLVITATDPTAFFTASPTSLVLSDQDPRINSWKLKPIAGSSILYIPLLSTASAFVTTNQSLPNQVAATSTLALKAGDWVALNDCHTLTISQVANSTKANHDILLTFTTATPILYSHNTEIRLLQPMAFYLAATGRQKDGQAIDALYGYNGAKHQEWAAYLSALNFSVTNAALNFSLISQVGKAQTTFAGILYGNP